MAEIVVTASAERCVQVRQHCCNTILGEESNGFARVAMPAIIQARRGALMSGSVGRGTGPCTMTDRRRGRPGSSRPRRKRPGGALHFAQVPSDGAIPRGRPTGPLRSGRWWRRGRRRRGARGWTPPMLRRQAAPFDSGSAPSSSAPRPSWRPTMRATSWCGRTRHRSSVRVSCWPARNHHARDHHVGG